MQYVDLEFGEELVICPLEIREDPRYIRDYILLANFLVMVLLPGVLLVFTNARIYRYYIMRIAPIRGAFSSDGLKPSVASLWTFGPNRMPCKDLLSFDF